MDVDHGIYNRLWTSNAPWVLAALQDFEGHAKMHYNEGELHDRVKFSIHEHWKPMVSEGSEELLSVLKGVISKSSGNDAPTGEDLMSSMATAVTTKADDREQEDA